MQRLRNVPPQFIFYFLSFLLLWTKWTREPNKLSLPTKKNNIKYSQSVLRSSSIPIESGRFYHIFEAETWLLGQHEVLETLKSPASYTLLPRNPINCSRGTFWGELLPRCCWWKRVSNIKTLHSYLILRKKRLVYSRLISKPVHWKKKKNKQRLKLNKLGKEMFRNHWFSYIVLILLYLSKSRKALIYLEKDKNKEGET